MRYVKKFASSTYDIHNLTMYDSTILHIFRHEYLAESAELESWIQEQYTAASSEDYGQDYEHLLVCHLFKGFFP